MKEFLKRSEFLIFLFMWTFRLLSFTGLISAKSLGDFAIFFCFGIMVEVEENGRSIQSVEYILFCAIEPSERRKS